MNIEIMHNTTKSIKVVPELTDLLFDQGWRFGRHVTNSFKYSEVEDNLDEMNTNSQKGFVNVLSY